MDNASFSTSDIVDSSLNLAHPAFTSNEHRFRVLEECHFRNIKAVILAANSLGGAKTNMQLIEETLQEAFSEHNFGLNIFIPKMFTNIGIKFRNLEQIPMDWEHRMRKFVGEHRKFITAIECELDYDSTDTSSALQDHMFLLQLRIASKYNLPVVVSNRGDGSFESLIRLLKPWRRMTKIVNSHARIDQKKLHELVEMDCYFTVNGAITNPKAYRFFHTMFENVPFDRILVASNAPFLCPQNIPAKFKYNDQNNENTPEYVVWICRKLCRYMNDEFDAVVKQIRLNSKRAYNMKCL